MTRNKLPSRRDAVTVDFQHVYPGSDPRTFTATVGFYPDGTIGETFVQLVNRKDKLVSADAHDATIVLSLAIQCGADLKEIGRSLLRDEHGRPHGFLGSLIDAVADMKGDGS